MVAAFNLCCSVFNLHAAVLALAMLSVQCTVSDYVAAYRGESTSRSLTRQTTDRLVAMHGSLQTA